MPSTVQMPAGIPVATFAIGEAGAANAALFAVAMFCPHDAKLGKKLAQFRLINLPRSAQRRCCPQRNADRRR
jgi:phosphoribosylcarboxyaminoimidazole (NCAIR) mutase